MQLFLEQLFIKTVNMSITASYAIFFVMVVRLFLKKVPKVFSYVLWAVVFFRLVCPVSFTANFSFLSQLQTNGTEYIPVDIGMMAEPRVNVGIGTINNAIYTSLPLATPHASVNPMQVATFIGSLVWATGILCLLAYGLVSYLMLKRRIFDAVIVSDNIYESENISTPFVLGTIRPKIYLPYKLSEMELAYVLKHEQTHIKRFDHFIKPVAFLVLCVHWFNPFVWLAFILMANDMEMSCDERVLKEIGTYVKKDYSSSLLSLATGKRMFGGSPLAFGESNTKSRIRNVLRYKNPAVWVTVSAIILVSVSAVILLADPISNETQSNTSQDIAIKEDFDLLGISLLIPANWKDKYIIETSSYERTNDRITFYYSEGGILFDIIRLAGSLTNEKDFSVSIPNLQRLLHGNGSTYAAVLPGDVQAPIEKGLEAAEEYNKMWREIDTVLNSMEIIPISPFQAERPGFSLYGTGYFTVELPIFSMLEESDDSGRMCWNIINPGNNNPGYIELVPWGTERLSSDGTINYIYVDDVGHERTLLVATYDEYIALYTAEEIARSLVFRGGSYNGVDLIGDSNIYMYYGAEKLFGQIEGFEMEEGRLTTVTIKLMQFQQDNDSGSGFKLIDMGQSTTYPLDFGGSVNILPLIWPNYNSYDMHYIPLLSDWLNVDGTLVAPYDYMYYDFILAGGNIKMILGHYIP